MKKHLSNDRPSLQIGQVDQLALSAFQKETHVHRSGTTKSPERGQLFADVGFLKHKTL